MEQLDDHEFILDLGTMMGLPAERNEPMGKRRGWTALLKRCCADALLNRLERGVPLEDKDTLKVERYTWCLTRDVGGITIEPAQHHAYREEGFLYLQVS
jgi:hypothetical protein